MCNLNVFSKTSSFEAIFDIAISFEKINWIEYFEYDFECNKREIEYKKNVFKTSSTSNCFASNMILILKKIEKFVQLNEINRTNQTCWKYLIWNQWLKTQLIWKKKTINIVFDIWICIVEMINYNFINISYNMWKFSIWMIFV